MQPIPVLDYAPSRANPLHAIYRSLRLPALVLAVGLLGGVVGFWLEPPTYKAAAYIQVDLSIPMDIRALESEMRIQLNWLRESAIPAVGWKRVTADLIPESRLIVIRSSDRDQARMVERFDRLIARVVGRPGLTVVSRPATPAGARTFIPAALWFVVAVFVAILALILRPAARRTHERR